MKSIILFLILLPAPVAVMAQTLHKNDELKFDADYYLMRQEFQKALDLYLNVLQTEPENADIKHRIGICYLNSEEGKEKAIPYLEEATKKVSTRYSTNSFKETNAPIESWFLLGSAYRVSNQLDAAIQAYGEYKKYLNPGDKYNLEVTDQYIQSCHAAREMQKEPKQVTFINLGGVINNNLPNFNAVVSGNGRILAYTMPGKQGYEIYLSTREDTAWSAPKNITSLLGAGKYMKTSSLSFDGTMLILVQEDPENADLYFSLNKKGRWSRAVPFPKPINSAGNETHGSLSPDGLTLYFTSVRKGGEGDLDIYRSSLQGAVWAKPMNLGPEINTPYNEETPFVSGDGHTLYFSSEGHQGIGGYDIFRYDFTHPEAGVVNLGYPINTTDNNLFYLPVGDGTTAYYSFTGPGTYGGRDIYLVNAPEEKKAALVAETVPEQVAPADSVEEPPVQVAQADSVEEPPELAEVTAEPQIPPVTTSAEVMPLAETGSAPVETLVKEPVEAEKESEPIVAPVKEPVEAEKESVPVVAPVEEPVDAEKEPEEAEMPAAIPPEKNPVVGRIDPSREFETEEPGRSRSWTVQFMALRKPVDLRFFKELSDISVLYKPDAWYRYTCVTTTDSIEAVRILNDLVRKGYTDAFIRRKNIIPRYTVQVMAVPGPVTDLTRFRDLPDISARKGRDTFCRYTTGEFERKEEALLSLKQIREQGYKKAFVRKVRTLQ